MDLVGSQVGKHPAFVFTYKGKPFSVAEHEGLV